MSSTTSNNYEELAKAVLLIPSNEITADNSGKNETYTFYIERIQYTISKESFELIKNSAAQVMGGFARDKVKQLINCTGQTFEVHDLDIQLSNTTSNSFEKTVFAYLDLLKQMRFTWAKIDNKSQKSSYPGIHIQFVKNDLIYEVDFIRCPGQLDFDINGLAITKWSEKKEPTFEIRSTFNANLKIGEVLENLKNKQFRIVYDLTGTRKSQIIAAIKILMRVIKMQKDGWKLVESKGQESILAIIQSSPNYSQQKGIMLKCAEGRNMWYSMEQFLEMYSNEHEKYPDTDRKNKYWTCSCHGVQTLLPWFKQE